MYSVLLECEHSFTTRVAIPRTGDEVFCRMCNAYRMVRYKSSDWRAKCVDCRYSRYCGSDKSWAERKASDHARLHSEHRVKVFRANNPQTWDLITAARTKLPEPDDAEIPY